MQIDPKLLKQRKALNELVTGLHLALSDVTGKLAVLYHRKKDIQDLAQISNNLTYELFKVENFIEVQRERGWTPPTDRCDEDKRDARIKAHAPEMYRILCEIREICKDFDLDSDIEDDIRVVLNAIDGKEDVYE